MSLSESHPTVYAYDSCGRLYILWHNTKAKERVFITETKCSQWDSSWRWGNSSASSM